MAFKFLLNVFETILGLDLENSSSKANCRTVTPVGLQKNKETCKREIFGQRLKL